MENEAEKLQAGLKFAAAFLKAHEEVKAKQAEKKECMYKKAVIAPANIEKLNFAFFIKLTHSAGPASLNLNPSME